MFCRNCGTNIGDFRYCPNCGADSQASTSDTHATADKTGGDSHDSRATDNIATEFADKVKSTFENITGGSNKDVQFKLSDLWSDVLQKHTRDESEQLLISGTARTTPTAAEMAGSWTRPWLYSRIFAVLAITFVLLLVCTMLFQNALSIPGLVFIGAMMMPFSLLVLFWETNIARNISIFELVKMFFVGGVLSLVFTLTLYSIVPVGELDVAGAILVGIVEEMGKLVAVAIFVKRSNAKYILNGMLIGAAVGAGFAVFESAGYALIYSSDVAAVVESIILRGLLSAGGHLVWAAMSGAAVMFAKGSEDFTLSIFKKTGFWKLFPVPIVLHSLWDMPFSNIVVLVVLVVIAWVFILALIRTGLAEISRVSAAATRALEAAASDEAAQPAESAQNN